MTTPIKQLISLFLLIICTSTQATLPNNNASLKQEPIQLDELLVDSFSVEENNICSDEVCLKLFKKLKKYANWGNPEAQVLVATAYLTGNGLEHNNELAVRHLRKAVKSGSNRARWMMSYLFKHGIGIEQDLTQASRLLNKAVNKNYPPALFQKAVEMLDFNGTNNDEAIELLSIAAEKNHKTAMYVLAKMSAYGIGSSIDKVKAAKLFKKLAFYGYRDSRSHLDNLIEQAKKKNNVNAEMQALIADSEVITVYGRKWDIKLSLTDKLARISRSNIYDGNSYGSHLRGRTCQNSTSKCLSYKGEDIDGFWSGRFTSMD
jgi:TPR repeat protein